MKWVSKRSCGLLSRRRIRASQLLVVDALEVWPDFPIDEARRASGLAEAEVAVAAVCTIPADGSTPTVNLKAPLVIGLESRVGIQVILDREELGMYHQLVAQEVPAEEPPPEPTATQPIEALR